MSPVKMGGVKRATLRSRASEAQFDRLRSNGGLVVRRIKLITLFGECQKRPARVGCECFRGAGHTMAQNITGSRKMPLDSVSDPSGFYFRR